MALRAPETDASCGVTRPEFKKFRQRTVGAESGAGRRLFFGETARRPFVIGRQGVLDDASSHFLHRDALQLVRTVGDNPAIEPRQRTATELLRALGGDVYKQKPAGDWCRAFNLDDVGGTSILQILLNHGQ